MTQAKPREIPLSAIPDIGAKSAEVARIWITDRSGSTVVIDPGVLADAEMFGVLMAEAEAAALIWRGLDSVRPDLDPDAVATIANHPGGLN